MDGVSPSASFHRHLMAVCGLAAQIHHDAKHSKVPFLESSIINLHEVHGGTTQGIAVRGSTKKK